MNITAVVGVVTASIAASVALLGYIINQIAARRERRAQAYAEALRAIRQYQEIPYRVARRKDSTAETRTQLDDQHGEIMSSIGFHLGWLRLESPVTATAYEVLWERCRTFGGVYRKWAWQQPLVSEDAQMAITLPFQYDIKPELDICIRSMRADTRFFAGSARRSVRKHAKDLAARRAMEAPPSFSALEGLSAP